MCHQEQRFINIVVFITDEQDLDESAEVLEILEKIDGETDNLDIPFVKMGDPRYARKWGVTKLPSVVYFRKRFPNIYRGKNRQFTFMLYVKLSLNSEGNFITFKTIVSGDVSHILNSN